MIRYLVILILVALGMQPVWGQATASLKGKVLDTNSGEEPIMYANLKVLKGGEMVAGGATDFDGNYNISNIPPGTYDVEITHIEYPILLVKGIELRSGATKTQNFEYKEKGQTFDIIEVEAERPIVQQDNPSNELVLTAQEISKRATRNISDLKGQKSGVVQKDAGQATHTAGSRASSDDTYVDGVRVFGSNAIPETEIEQIQIITSGIPAEYGDATGAITNITTKGPSNTFQGGIQVETSEFLDAFGANRVDISFAGPILKTPVKDAEGNVIMDGEKPKTRTLLGYRVSGSFYTVKDASPSAIGSYKLKDEVLDRLQANPLVLDNTGGRVNATDYLSADDIEKIKARQNARESYGIVTGRLDYKPTNDVYVSAGFNGQFNWGKSGGVANRLFNYEDNTQYKSNTLRGNLRLRHSVSSTIFNATNADSTTRQPVFQNLNYEIQADYTSSAAESYDPRYQDRLFEYGYVGKISRSLVPVAGEVARMPVLNTNGDTLGYETVMGHTANFIQFNGYTPATDINPVLSAYNNLIDMNTISSMEQLEIVNGRFTGNRASVFGLYNNLGFADAGYGKSLSTQLRANVKVNFDLVHGKKDPIRHYIQLGGTYEQRIERSYSIDPFNLWTLADQSANDHLEYAADRNGAVIGTFYDASTNRYYDQYTNLIRTDEEGRQVPMTAFGENLRQQLGLTAGDWVNVHELSPSQLNINMFDPTLLIQGRQAVLSYYGYDYLGNVSGNNVEFNDFFTEVDANGRKTRAIAPFKPIYVAGYIQDKFTYKDIIVRAGVRIESYDVNTKVLKDPYSIAGTFTAAEFENASSGYSAGIDPDYTRPGTIGDDYVVYVTDNSPDASIVGYRSGNKWFNAAGTAVNNARELGANFVPALRSFNISDNDPQGETYDPNQAFTDYKPNVIVMPRLSFAFPIIKDVSSFYANYDVLAQRPAGQNFASPLTYYNFRELVGRNIILPNSNLESQRVVNYEIGYEQALNRYSRFKLAMLYREERNLIQMKQYFFAYPIQYSSFANDDFSTTKQFMVEYELRPKKRSKDLAAEQPGNLRLNFAYTLQFAEGTGSSPTTSAMIAATDLKYVFPLDFDQRHTFNVNIDYRFDKNTTNKILRNLGANLSFTTFSGSPYTRKRTPGGIGSSFAAGITEGSINGAVMPWSYRVDLRIDRDFILGGKEKGQGTARSKEYRLNVYVRVQNLLDTRNILNVYPATGSPDDDGFLTLENSQGLGLLGLYSSAYPTLYGLRMNNPAHFSLPRRIFLGAIFSF